MASESVITALDRVIRDRFTDGDPEHSYVARLHQTGLNTILEKVGEECTETLIAAKDGSPSEIVSESADLLFHLLVMLAETGTSGEAVLKELDRRFGLSGIAEKNARG